MTHKTRKVCHSGTSARHGFPGQICHFTNRRNVAQACEHTGSHTDSRKMLYRCAGSSTRAHSIPRRSRGAISVVKSRIRHGIRQFQHLSLSAESSAFRSFSTPDGDLEFHNIIKTSFQGTKWSPFATICNLSRQSQNLVAFTKPDEKTSFNYFLLRPTQEGLNHIKVPHIPWISPVLYNQACTVPVEVAL